MGNSISLFGDPTAEVTPVAATVPVSTLAAGQQIVAEDIASTPFSGYTRGLAVRSSRSAPVVAVDLARPTAYQIQVAAYPYTAHEGTQPDLARLNGNNLIQSNLASADAAQAICDSQPDCLYYVYKPSNRTYDVYALPGKTPANLSGFWMPPEPNSAADPVVTYVKVK
jgi:hypothetical protein